jgi:hypothetical protein
MCVEDFQMFPSDRKQTEAAVSGMGGKRTLTKHATSPHIRSHVTDSAYCASAAAGQPVG